MGQLVNHTSFQFNGTLVETLSVGIAFSFLERFWDERIVGFLLFVSCFFVFVALLFAFLVVPMFFAFFHSHSCISPASCHHLAGGDGGLS